MQIAEQWKKAMKASGIKRKDLAKALGISRPYVTHLLSGKANLTIGTIKRVTSVIGGKFEIWFQ